MVWKPVSVLYALACTDCGHRFDSFGDRHALCPLCCGESRVRGLTELWADVESDGDDQT